MSGHAAPGWKKHQICSAEIDEVDQKLKARTLKCFMDEVTWEK